MQRCAVAFVFIVLIVFFAMSCAGEEDDRPRTLEYITKAVLQPSCGTAACHSTFRQTEEFVFDTVEAARRTFQQDVILLPDPAELTATNPPQLIIVLTKSYEGAPRMPLDAPLPNADIVLIDDWIRLGGPGVCVGTASCHGSDLVACTADGAYDFKQVDQGGCL